MFCTQCGSDVRDGAIACPGCGTRLTAQGPARPAQSASPAGMAGPAASHAEQVTGPAFRFDPNRLTTGDRITGISTALLLVSLFLPWYGVSFLGINAEADGLTGHGYLYIVLLLCLAILAYLGLWAGSEELPARLPLAHEQHQSGVPRRRAGALVLSPACSPRWPRWRRWSSRRSGPAGYARDPAGNARRNRHDCTRLAFRAGNSRPGASSDTQISRGYRAAPGAAPAPTSAPAF